VTGRLNHDPESEAWDDMYETTWGPQDTEDNHIEMPDGFIWICCQQRSSEEKVGYKNCPDVPRETKKART
jgi:hypothetical protein